MPLLVLIGGLPGSGKTTLARKLADTLRLPHLNRDTLYSGYHFTTGERLHPQANQELLFSTATGLLDGGVSVVLDMTTYRGEMERDVTAGLLSRAYGILVFTYCEDPRGRFHARMSADPATTPEQVEAQMARWPRTQRLASEPLELDLPLLRVRTEDGYQPGIDAVAEFVRRGIS